MTPLHTLLLVLASVALANAATTTLRPIFMLHGINNKPSCFDIMQQTVERQHPGTLTIPVHSYDGIPWSWVALHTQVTSLIKQIRKHIHEDPAAFEQGYHLVCHSQGALLCRVAVQQMDDHSFRTFVSLAGPQMGVYGPQWLSFLPSRFRGETVDSLHHLMYQGWAQSSISVANMWNDPYHHSEYVKGNKFLPYVNGLNTDKEDLARMKTNFVRLNRAVFLVGNETKEKTEFDGGIEPWQTGIWSFHEIRDKKPNATAIPHFVPLHKQPLYTEDLIGLRQLNERGSLVLGSPAEIGHDDWIYNASIIERFILTELD